jgi:hypothetical protein
MGRMKLKPGSKLTQKKPDWTPFEEAFAIPPTELKYTELARVAGLSVEEIKACYAEQKEGERIFKNNLYQVSIRDRTHGDVGIWHLSIRRLDRAAVHDWRHFQRIKNELVGPEYEGIELYPAESRLVDSANQYHLWVFKDEAQRWPVGFNDKRFVQDESTSSTKQRPR